MASRVNSASSPSFNSINSDVSLIIAIASEEMTLKSAPTPSNSGDLFLAANKVSGCSRSIKATAYEPSKHLSVSLNASAVANPFSSAK